MAVTINASTSAGLVTSADTTGDLNIQSGGSTKIAVTSAGVAVTGLSKGSLPTGSILQVVNATFGTLVSTSSATFADTGLTLNITPTSATSKILVTVNCNGLSKSTSAQAAVGLRLLRNSTTITSIDGIAGYTNSTTLNHVGGVSSSYLDSPATTSATTYKVQFASAGGVAAANMNDYYNGNFTTTSTITLMEIAS
jgi:hypothetical protein